MEEKIKQLIEQYNKGGFPLPALKSENQNYYAELYLSYIESKKISLDFSSIQEFISECKVYYSPSTLKVIKSGIKGYLEQISPIDDRYFALIAKIEKLFKSIKIGKAKRLSQDEILTEDELLILLEGAYIQKRKEETWFEFDEKEKLIFEFLSLTGMRISEMILLRKDNIKRSGSFYKIDFTGKGFKERVNYIPVKLFNRINKVFNGNEYLFEEIEFYPITKLSKKETMKQYSTKYRHKIKDRLRYYSKLMIGRSISPHGFRHYFATKWLKEGKSLKAIANWLGHSTTAITSDMYVHDELDPRELYNKG